MEQFVSDEDLEILEQYLDGGLPSDEAGRVLCRLSVDPAWGAAVDRLRAQRVARRAAWRSLEPDAASADAAATRATERAVRHDRWTRAARFGRRSSAVAAALLLAFGGGWVARGSGGASVPGRAGLDSAVASQASPVPGQAFQVALTDGRGNIVAVQQFSDPRVAREFAEDVGRWQARRRQDDAAELLRISDEF